MTHSGRTGSPSGEYESSRTFAKVPKTILLWTPRACGARIGLKWMCGWGGPTGHPTHTSTSENDEPRSGEESGHEGLETIQRSNEKFGMTQIMGK
jgi:hypothetical protein